jgi:hypothetical protein
LGRGQASLFSLDGKVSLNAEEPHVGKKMWKGNGNTIRLLIILKGPELLHQERREVKILYCIEGVVIATLMYCDLLRFILTPLEFRY